MAHLHVARRSRALAGDSRQMRVATHAMGSRVIGFGIDLLTFVLAAPVVLGLCAVVLRDLWPAGATLAVAGYLMSCWMLSGQTLGMHLAGVRLVDERTGRPPSLAQVVMRTVLTLPPLVGGATLLNEVLTAGASAVPEPLLLLAGAAFAMGVLSVAYASLDHGRMLHDRLCGITAVRERGPLAWAGSRR